MLPDRITSDCQAGAACPYIDHVDGVTAKFDGEGHFVLKVSNTDKPGIRDFGVDFDGACVSNPTSLCRPPFTGRNLVSRNAKIQTEAAGLEGLNGTNGDLRLNLLFQAVDPEDGVDKFWFLTFQVTPEIYDPNNPCFGTSGVSVTHWAGTDRWVFEAGATDVACLQAQPLGGNTVREFRGKYIMPFKITAVIK